MDNFDRIDALRIYYSQYGYDNYRIIKEVCKNLHQYDSLSYFEIKEILFMYIRNITVDDITENNITQIIDSLSMPSSGLFSTLNFSQFLNMSPSFDSVHLNNMPYSMSMSMNNSQEDVSIVLKKVCLDK